MSAFSASKYALEGFTEALRAEVEPLGLHIGQVSRACASSKRFIMADRVRPTLSRSGRQQRLLPLIHPPTLCVQVHPGLVKSNFMERAEFFGKDNAEERKSFRQLVRDS